MYTIEGLREICAMTHREVDGKWVPARPEVNSFFSRLMDAWKVLIGKADAVSWYKQ